MDEKMVDKIENNADENIIDKIDDETDDRSDEMIADKTDNKIDGIDNKVDKTVDDKIDEKTECKTDDKLIKKFKRIRKLNIIYAAMFLSMPAADLLSFLGKSFPGLRSVTEILFYPLFLPFMILLFLEITYLLYIICVVLTILYIRSLKMINATKNDWVFFFIIVIIYITQFPAINEWATGAMGI